MNISIIRPTLIYGPNMRGNLENMHRAIKSGWFPPIPRIKNKKSLIHVDDLVRAIWFVINRNDTNGQIYIASDGNNYSTNEIYEGMLINLDKSIPYFRIPLSVFNIVGYFNRNIGYKFEKLFDDQEFSSEKLKNLGFESKLSFKDFNKKIF